MNSDDDRSSVSSDQSRAQSIKGSFRRRLKSISSTADRSRHSIIDGTKTVGSRMMKKALRRRTSSEIREIQEEPKDDRIAHQGACEIFETIKFEFPAFAALQAGTLSPDEGLPPPPYPPPPLPERFYDDVFSDRSSNSYSDSQYELLDKYKQNEDSTMSIPLFRHDSFDLESDRLSSSLGNELEIRSFLINGFNDDEKYEEDVSETFSNLEISDISQNESKALASDSVFSSSETSSSGKSAEVRSFDYNSNRNAYENWHLPTMREVAVSPAPSTLPLQSVISEFDPLFDSICSEADLPFEDLNLFGNSSNKSGEGGSDSHETKESETNVPSELHSVSAEKLSEFLSKGKRKNSIKSTASISGWSNMKKAVKAVSEVSSWSPNVIRRVSMSLVKDTSALLKTTSSTADMYVKPDICSKEVLVHLHNGYLYKSTGDRSAKDFVKRWCQISAGKLHYSVDKDTPKEFIDLNTVLSVTLIKDQKQNNDGEELYCFEITTSSTRNRGHIFAATCTPERCMWMQKLVENLTSFFSAQQSSDYTKMGWCWMKEGINGIWTTCWLLLRKRTLTIARNSSGQAELLKIDLRQARYVALQSSKDAHLFGSQQQQVILLDTVSQSLYLIMGKSSETVEWQKVLRVTATDNGISLDDQQITKDDIPVIVEKCINFIYAHGSMSEGIYRRNGSNSSVTKLLSLFRQDSWSVQLSRQEYTEHDVANVLKRFFRDLPEPLFTSHLHTRFCNAPAIQCSEEDKLSLYRSILEQLAPVNYVTVRKLIGHLYFIHGQHEKNLMPVENLASIWGPTLMPVENNESSQWSKRECEAVRDLILYYPKLFMVDDEELEKETKMREVLERYHNSTTFIPQTFKPSSGLIVFIYLNSKDSGDCVRVTLDPNRCCNSVCEEFAPRMQTQPHLLCLQEVVCNETLKRPLHHQERIWDSVIRWGYWDEEDRKNCYLLLTDNRFLREVTALAKPPGTITSELKYADRKAKSFKSHLFEISQGKLYYYKDKKTPLNVREWNIEDIIWYDGFESKRDPHSRWAITFINKKEEQKRTKETPFFGYTLAGSQKEEQLRWIAALLLAQHSSDDLLPPVTLLK